VTNELARLMDQRAQTILDDPKYQKRLSYVLDNHGNDDFFEVVQLPL